MALAKLVESGERVMGGGGHAQDMRAEANALKIRRTNGGVFGGGKIALGTDQHEQFFQ